MRIRCRIAAFLFVMVALPVNVDAQNNYWTRKVKIPKTKTVRHESIVTEKQVVTVNRTPDSLRTGRVLQKAEVSPVQMPQLTKPVSVAAAPPIFDVPQLYTGFYNDSLYIQFRLDSIRIDMDFAGNREAWDNFERVFRKHYAHVSPRSLRLDIYSGASPEGTAAHNRWLGENRGIAIRRLVRHRLGNKVGGIIVHNEAARWDGLYELLSASSEPWRDEALHIIEQPASTDEHQRDLRELQLRALWDGAAWPTLRDKYLSPLRSGATAILSYASGRDTIVVRAVLMLTMAGQRLGNLFSESLSGFYAPTFHFLVWVRLTCRLNGRSTTRIVGV